MSLTEEATHLPLTESKKTIITYTIINSE